MLHPVSDSNYIIFLRLIITVEEQFEHNMPFWNKLANRVRGDVMFLSITSMEHRIRKIAALPTFLLHPYYNTSLRYLQLAKIENIFISLKVLLPFLSLDNDYRIKLKVATNTVNRLINEYYIKLNFLSLKYNTSVYAISYSK